MNEWALRLFLVAMGMMLNAVIFATGQFCRRGNFGLAGFFLVISLATAIILVLHLAYRETPPQSKSRDSAAICK